MRSQIVSRRGFLARTAVGALALPAFVDRAFSASPSERLVTGHVGLGGRGGHLLGQALAHGSLQVGAVCDVDARHLGRAHDRTGKKAAAIKDKKIKKAPKLKKCKDTVVHNKE